MMREPHQFPKLKPEDAKAVFASGAVFEVNRHDMARLIEAGRTLVAEAEHQADLLAHATRQLAVAQEQVQRGPRTITLAYMPRTEMPEKWDGNESPPDTGGYWTVSENGRHQWGLDPRETLALVAAMLLGAQHPPLQSCLDHEREGARRVRCMTRIDAGEQRTVQPETVTIGDGEAQS